MRASIVSIGDELVLGQTVDTNSAYLANQLAELGIVPAFHLTVPDDQPAITHALEQACDQTDLVLITGGLGPTEDDLTRQALAACMHVELELDATSLAQIEAFFAQRNRPMAASNRIQAYRPRGARCLANACGTAPGLAATLGQARVFIMPGVPREMFAMWRDTIRPEVEHVLPTRDVILTTKINTFGLGESNIGQRLGPLMQRDRNPKVGTTVSGGIVSVRIRSEFPTAPQAQQALDATAHAVRACLGPIVFGQDDQTMQADVIDRLRARGLSLVTAESCTGGLLGSMLTEVPGSSEVYRGGWITYANAMKTAQLAVPDLTLAQHGAVSAPTAALMARNAREQSGADVAVSITGIAGPDGGSDAKPVGTVWIGLSRLEAGYDRTEAWHMMLPGFREMVRDRAAKSALQMLRLHLMGEPIQTLSWATQG